jgi:hypothetical protein
MSDARPAAGDWPGARTEIHDLMVQVLESSHRFARLPQRHTLITRVSMRRRIELSVPSVDHERTHLQFIVRACAQQQCLADLVEAVKGDLDEQLVWRLRQLNDEWDGSSNFELDRWKVIKGILEQADVSNRSSLFRAAQPQTPPPQHCRNVWHLFAYLAGSNANDQGVPLYMIFLRLVADQLESSLGRPLKRLLSQLASEWNITGSFQRVFFERSRDVGGGDQNAALLILIDPHRMMADTYTVTHWYGWSADRGTLVKGGDQVVARDGLEGAVQRIVQAAETAWPTDDRRLRIEFILPFDLLNAPVERWPKEIDPAGPVPLYKHYSVVVRSLDRIRDPARHRVWRARWRMLEQSPTLARCQYSEDVPQRLEETITLDSRVVAVVLSEPPELLAGDGMSEIRMAIRTGVPIIVWHRSERPDAAFRRAVDESFNYGEIAELPDRAFELRLAPPVSDDGLAEVGRNLVLLWDDPIRLPEEFRTVASGGVQ